VALGVKLADTIHPAYPLSVSSFRSLFIALLMFSTAGFAFPQAGARIPLRGHLVVPGVTNLENIEIRLVNQSGVVVSRAYTNSQGDFELTGYIGTFSVESTLDGFAPIRERVDVINNSGGGAAIMSLAFTRTERVGPPMMDADSIDRTQWTKEVLDEYDKALEDNRKGNTAKAEARLESVIRKAPDFYSAHNALGTLYQQEKRFADAEREYRQARELNPRSAQPLVNLGSLYLQSAEARAAQGPAVVNPLQEAAVVFLQEAVRMDAQSAPAYALLGTLAYRNGNLAAAEEDLTRALRLDPHLSSALLTLANVYSRSQKWENALSALDTYLEDNPKAPNRVQIQQARARVVESMQAK
jgi:Flp pilus assembly protein TadD